jgi:hypothetical protein
VRWCGMSFIRVFSLDAFTNRTPLGGDLILSKSQGEVEFNAVLAMR